MALAKLPPFLQAGSPETAPYTTFNPYTAIDYRNDVAKRDQQRTPSPEAAPEPESEFTNLPEVVSADTYQGKEVVQDDDKEVVRTHDGKEVVAHGEKEVAHVEDKERVNSSAERLPETYDEEKGREPAHAPPLSNNDAVDAEKADAPGTKKRLLDRRICGIRAKWGFLALAVLIVAIIALGAGLGAAPKSKKKTGTSSQSNSSSAGAMIGTKIAVLGQSFGATNENTLVLYFQHQTGSIRWMKRTSDGTWTGGDASTIIANDAKNSTAITGVSYVWDGASFWRLYYIDNTKTLKELWMGNVTDNWTLGPLSNLNLSPLDADDVGLVACWAGPTSDDGDVNLTTKSSGLIVRLVYASDATTFKQLSYTGETQVYDLEQTLPNLNGHATPACYTSAPGSVDYMMFTDLQNAVNVYWRDTNTSLASNSTSHAINHWTNSSISCPYIDPSATLSYTADTLFAQGKFDDLIGGYDITFDAENTTSKSISAEFSVQGNAGLPGTGLSTIAYNGEVLVFFQTTGGEILEYKRPLDDASGQWTGTVIQIPVE